MRRVRCARHWRPLSSKERTRDRRGVSAGTLGCGRSVLGWWRLMPQRFGQTELLERGPSRRLIVPEGRGAWWGVDPSTKRVAVGVVWPASAGDVRRTGFMVGFPALVGGARHAHIFFAAQKLARSVVANAAWVPGVVWVEQPSGKQQSPELSYAVGATLGGLSAGIAEGLLLREPSPAPVLVETVPSSSWKLAAVGRGDVRKPKVASGPYGVLTWARSVGYAGDSWDEADAWGIAEAARRTIELEQR
jgi:hypothetical protein